MAMIYHSNNVYTLEEIQHNRSEWLKELRYGRHKQGFGKLRMNDGSLCCLGVATQCYVRDGLGDFKFALDTFDGVPDEIMHSLGLMGTAGYTDIRVSANNKAFPDSYLRVTLSMLNDQFGYNFGEIADLIDEGCLPIFVVGVDYVLMEDTNA